MTDPTARPATSSVPARTGADWATDVRAVADDLRGRLGRVADDAWDVPAVGLDWTCRETVAHVLDDLLAYATQISGSHGTDGDYVPFAETPRTRPDGPEFWLWPEPARGTSGILTGLDATAGVFAAVLATCPPDRIGWHPWSPTDVTGFAAMGLTETVLHAWEVLGAQGQDYRPDPAVVGHVLDRIFPGVERTDDPWHDLLAATGRTEQTRGMPWRWDARVRG